MANAGQRRPIPRSRDVIWTSSHAVDRALERFGWAQRILARFKDVEYSRRVISKTLVAMAFAGTVVARNGQPDEVVLLTIYTDPLTAEQTEVFIALRNTDGKNQWHITTVLDRELTDGNTAIVVCPGAVAAAWRRQQEDHAPPRDPSSL